MTSTPDHQHRAHSSLGASIAHRWTNCPGSVNFCKGAEDKPSQFAAWGTAAHEVAERCLKGNEPAEVYYDRVFTVDGFKIVCDEEMCETVDVYVDYVRNLAYGGSIMSVEESFSLDQIHPGMYGTNDALVYNPKEKHLHVIDLKGGQGKAVDATDNAQLKYYALGALLKNSDWGVEKITLTIVQPRAAHRDGPIRSWSTTPLELQMWGDDLSVLAKKTQDPTAPLVAGEWCRWCPREGSCPANKASAIKSAMADFAAHPADLDEQDLVSILHEAGRIEDWVRAVKKYAFEKLSRGDNVPGYKLVAKRAQRKWDGAEVDIVAAVRGVVQVDDAMLYSHELKSPAQIEKLLPKHLRPVLEEFVQRRSSGVTLALEEDKRPAVVPGDATVDFSEVAD